MFYDGYCLLCSKARRLVAKLDWLNRIKAVNLYDADALKNVHFDVPETQKLVADIHLIRTDGKTYFGFKAVRKIGTLLPLTALFAYFLYLPGLSHIADKIYSYLAKNRTRNLR